MSRPSIAEFVFAATSKARHTCQPVKKHVSQSDQWLPYTTDISRCLLIDVFGQFLNQSVPNLLLRYSSVIYPAEIIYDLVILLNLEGKFIYINSFIKLAKSVQYWTGKWAFSTNNLKCFLPIWCRTINEACNFSAKVDCAHNTICSLSPIWKDITHSAYYAITSNY